MRILQFALLLCTLYHASSRFMAYTPFSSRSNSRKSPISQPVSTSPSSPSSSSSSSSSSSLSTSISALSPRTKSSPRDVATGLVTSIKKTLRTGRLGFSTFYADFRAQSTLKSQSQKTMAYKDFSRMKRHEADRSRAANMAFLAIFASEYLPYFVMYNPKMLPSTFQARYHSPSAVSEYEDKVREEIDGIKRRRFSSIVKAGLDLTESGYKVPYFMSINPFKRSAVTRLLKTNRKLTNDVAEALRTQSHRSLVEKLSPLAYYNASISTSAVDKFPAILTNTLASMLNGDTFYKSFCPQFVFRSQFKSYMKALGETDDFFLEHEDKEIVKTLDAIELGDVNNARCMLDGGDKEDMRRELEEYLDIVKKLEGSKEAGTVGAKGGLRYDKNAGRGIVVGANAIRGMKSDDSSVVGALFSKAAVWS